MGIERKKGVIVIELRYHITKEQEGTYFTIPFDVPDNVEKIIISYDYYRKAKGFIAALKPTNTIDIGIEDNQGRFLGWSGSARKTISVGEYASTPGYLCEKIVSGKWGIITGAYHVMPEGVDITYTIDFQYKGQRLLFGDLHVHSTASDGTKNLYELGVMAKRKGLDFLALANHNNYSENYYLPHIDGVTFIPAVEWTHYKGHINLYGVENPFDNSFIANSKEEMQALISNARSKGAVVSVNHPKCRFCPYLWNDENVFDLVEIWNGPMRKSNKNAVDWWTEMLCNGRHLPAVGGSDFHKPLGFSKLGNPVTGVYAESPDPEDILDAVKNGKAFISRGVNSIRLNLKYKNASMGDTVKYNPSVFLTAESNAKSVILVTNKGEKRIKMTNGKAEIELPKVTFAYIKAVNGFGRLKTIAAISNPIYFE